MAVVGRVAGDEQRGFSPGQIKQQVLLVPEAPVLFALLLIGWAYAFPPAVGALAALTVCVFILRLFLLTSAEQALERAHYRQADRFSRAALWVYPWSVDALALRANSYFLQGDDAAAESILRDAVRLAPDSDALHSALAGALLARGDIAGGREHAARAHRLAAGSPFAAQHLSWLALHVEGDPIKTQRMLNTLDEDLPAQLAAPLLVLRGEAQLARGSLLAARETMHAIGALLPACPIPQQAELCYHLGRLHALLGEESRQYFRRSVDLDPNGRWAHAAWRAAVDQKSVGS